MKSEHNILAISEYITKAAWLDCHAFVTATAAYSPTDAGEQNLFGCSEWKGRIISF